MNGLALCSGAGGLELGLRLALGDGYRCVCHVERDGYAAATLVARMEDAAMDPAPIWDDLTTFDGTAWRGSVDLVSAGFPCQPFSLAGKRVGLNDERWLWPDVARIVREIRPRYVFLENVPELVRHGLASILGDLAALGFAAEWDLFSAAEVGAPHIRRRFFLLADAQGVGQREPTDGPHAFAGSRSTWAKSGGRGGLDVADASSPRRQQVPRSAYGNEATDEGWSAIDRDRPQRGDEVMGHSDCGAVPQSEWESQGRDGSRSPGEAVANAVCCGWGASQRDDGTGRSDLAGSGTMGNADCTGCGELGIMLSGDEDPSRRHDADRHGSAVGVGQANPDRSQRQGHGGGVGTPAQESTTDRDRYGFLFPPGRDDFAGWSRLLAIDPSLEPAVRRDADGLADRLDRVRVIGNGVVPVVAAVAFLRLRDRLGASA